MSSAVVHSRSCRQTHTHSPRTHRHCGGVHRALALPRATCGLPRLAVLLPAGKGVGAPGPKAPAHAAGWSARRGRHERRRSSCAQPDSEQRATPNRHRMALPCMAPTLVCPRSPLVPASLPAPSLPLGMAAHAHLGGRHADGARYGGPVPRRHGLPLPSDQVDVQGLVVDAGAEQRDAVQHAQVVRHGLFRRGGRRQAQAPHTGSFVRRLARPKCAWCLVRWCVEALGECTAPPRMHAPPLPSPPRTWVSALCAMEPGPCASAEMTYTDTSLRAHRRQQRQRQQRSNPPQSPAPATTPLHKRRPLACHRRPSAPAPQAPAGPLRLRSRRRPLAHAAAAPSRRGRHSLDKLDPERLPLLRRDGAHARHPALAPHVVRGDAPAVRQRRHRTTRGDVYALLTALAPLARPWRRPATPARRAAEARSPQRGQRLPRRRRAGERGQGRR